MLQAPARPPLNLPIQVAALELQRRRRARTNFRDFVSYTFQRYKENWHHVKVSQALQEVADGLLDRLMVNLPPRHSKTELASRRFPAFFLGKNPTGKVIGCSYSADLAKSVSRDVQRIMTSARYASLFPETAIHGAPNAPLGAGVWKRSSQEFETIGHAGTYRAAGIGGPITGQGMTLGIVDDPFKNAEEADSRLNRERVWDWYQTTFLTRDEGNAKIVCVFTRWHEDDLAGRILENAKKTGERWKVINFPALKEQDGDPEDPRKVGAALWPEKFSEEHLIRTRSTISARWWSSLYQQRPAPIQGAILKREYWKYYEPGEEPPFLYKFHSWDTAHGSKEGDARSVCTVWGATQEDLFLLDVWKGRVEFPELKAQAVALASRDLPGFVLVEDKASGKDLIPELRRGTRLPIVPVQVTKDKETRAHAASPVIESGRVFLPSRAPWLADFLDETASFPRGRLKDQVDSLTQAVTWWRLKQNVPTLRVREI